MNWNVPEVARNLVDYLESEGKSIFDSVLAHAGQKPVEVSSAKTDAVAHAVPDNARDNEQINVGQVNQVTHIRPQIPASIVGIQQGIVRRENVKTPEGISAPIGAGRDDALSRFK